MSMICNIFKYRIDLVLIFNVFTVIIKVHIADIRSVFRHVKKTPTHSNNSVKPSGACIILPKTIENIFFLADTKHRSRFERVYVLKWAFYALGVS
jgi:hypothetical protein